MGALAAPNMANRYLTSDPTQSLALTRDGRPQIDFAAAPSIFLEEDLARERELLEHRGRVREDLDTAEKNETAASDARKVAEQVAEASIAEERMAAARAAEAREIEVRSVEQRSAIEASYSDAEMQARCCIARAQKLRDMLEQDCAYSERKSLEAKAYRAAPIDSVLGA